MEGFYPYPDNPNYLVSKDGEVFSLYWKRKIKGTLSQSGYYILNMNQHTNPKVVFVHRMVARTFLGESDLDVNHKNKIKTDNRLENLEYVTRRENNCHRLKKPVGTYWSEVDNAYKTKIDIDGRSYFIGHYETEEDSMAAYSRVSRFFGIENKYISAPKPEPGRVSQATRIEIKKTPAIIYSPRNKGHWKLRNDTCPSGHPYDEKNTFYHHVNGARQCRECKTIAQRRRREAKKATKVFTSGNCPVCYEWFKFLEKHMAKNHQQTNCEA